MANWHFFQGVRGEWRWYRVDESGDVRREADYEFPELEPCMADAREAGFRDSEFAVHARSRLPQFPRRRQSAVGGPVERRRAATIKHSTAAGADEYPRSGSGVVSGPAHRRRRAD